MSKSTSIFELNQNSNMDTNTSDTRPIVADILKEIEMQNNNNNQNDYVSEQQKALDYQIDNLATVGDISSHQQDQIHEQAPIQTDNQEMINQVQIENEINKEILPSSNTSHYSLDNDDTEMDIDDVLTQKLPTIQEIPDTDISETQTNSTGTIHNLYNKFRDPLLIFLLAMIVTIPQVQRMINGILINIPLFRTTTGHMVFKSFLLATLYYYLNQYI